MSPKNPEPRKLEARSPPAFLEPSRDLLNLLRRTGFYRPLRYVYRKVKRVEDYLRAKGVIIRPLVPEAELFEAQKNAMPPCGNAIPLMYGATISNSASFRGTRCR